MEDETVPNGRVSEGGGGGVVLRRPLSKGDGLEAWKIFSKWALGSWARVHVDLYGGGNVFLWRVSARPAGAAEESSPQAPEERGGAALLAKRAAVAGGN